MNIKSHKIDIDPETRIADDAEIIASDSIHIGKYAVIGSSFKAKCRNLHIGKHVYIGDNVGIGGGGCMGLNSNVGIGEQSLIADGSFINCAESVTIGRHVAFGYEVQIWTHGVWQPVADGFYPQKQQPVEIGDEVWLPSRCQVLPGVTIGDNVVVGMGSLVNKSLPSGCMAVGVPAQIIHIRRFPARVSDEMLFEILSNLVDEYMLIAEDKGFQPVIKLEKNSIIHFQDEQGEVIFYTREGTFKPIIISDYAEDFRDFLRRNGFPFYGGGFFRSLTPIRFKEMHDYTCDSGRPISCI